MMANHAGQVVRIVGKAAQLAGSELVVQTSDQGNVAVDLARDTQLRGEGYVEIVGKVDENGERLREFTSVDFGDKLGECRAEMGQGAVWARESGVGSGRVRCGRARVASGAAWRGRYGARMSSGRGAVQPCQGAMAPGLLLGRSPWRGRRRLARRRRSSVGTPRLCCRTCHATVGCSVMLYMRRRRPATSGPGRGLPSSPSQPRLCRLFPPSSFVLRTLTSGMRADMALVEAVVQLSAKVPALFAESSN
jgi:hypothetical protein